jgi:two-component system OmpR family response regulator
MSKPLQKILCIDDEEDILEVMKLALETIGNLDVHTCNNSAKAVQEAQSVKPDLIVLDVMMPEMDGPATLKLLQANDNVNKIPVLFMTARVQQSEINEYLALGVVGVIAKPFDPMTLTDQIKTLWEARNG